MRSKVWFALISFFISASIFRNLRARCGAKIDIVIETVLDRRAGGELRFRPDLQNGGGQDVRSRVTQPFDVRHLGAHFGCFTFFSHGKAQGCLEVAILQIFWK